MKLPQTLGALKATEYRPKSIKEELRANLIDKLRQNKPVFDGILGFDETVLPDIQRAILSRHNILLLGLRGQAKTRIARLLVHLLDEYIPVVKGSQLNDDPLNPISRYALDLIAEKGEETPIDWLHRDERYVEKLATPDVSIADLIGDVDPIKAASLKLDYSDERVIHFGLVPRAHRSIFVLNELPDLQARIQVSLFNILQEGDIQIRGFKLRLPLDIQCVFTANPEDYTNRGSIITPLKDRIESQILTHYPKTIAVAKAITQQEARLTEVQKASIEAPDFMQDLLEEIAFSARESEFIDEKSGVSARLSIAAFENLISTAEQRLLINKEKKTVLRIADLWGIIPAITGKVELVYEGEQEGPEWVALHLINTAIYKAFIGLFPNPEDSPREDEKDPYGTIKAWFSARNKLELISGDSDKNFRKTLQNVAGLQKLVESKLPNAPKSNHGIYMELVLHGLAAANIIDKNKLSAGLEFRDPLAGMLGENDFFDN